MPHSADVKKYLKEFYAVTKNSLYCASVGGVGQAPFIIKIISRDKNNRIKLGEKIDNGSMIAIGTYLQFFTPESDSPILPQKVNWGGCTSKIVALFMDKNTALQCVGSQDYVPCDPRWKKNTIEVLRAIGTDHLYFSVSTDNPNFWLLPPEEWQTVK